MAKCKFCGKEFTTEKFLSPSNMGLSCGECTSFCMKKCKIDKKGWYFEPCLSCEENPYKKNKVWRELWKD